MANFVSNDDALEVLDKYAKGIKKGIGVVAVRETSPAAAAHAVGDYIRYSGTVYKVKSAISIGDSLILNTNIEAHGLPDDTTIYTPGLDEENFSEEISSIVNVYGSKNLVFKTISQATIDTTGTIINDSSYTLAVAKVKSGQEYIASKGFDYKVLAFYTSEPTLNSVSYDGSRIVEDLTSLESFSFTSPIDGYAVFRTNIAFVKPMIRLASIKDNTYVPYAKTNRELTESKADNSIVSFNKAGSLTKNDLNKSMYVQGQFSVDFVAGSSAANFNLTISNKYQYGAFMIIGRGWIVAVAYKSDSSGNITGLETQTIVGTPPQSATSSGSTLSFIVPSYNEVTIFGNAINGATIQFT